MGKFKKNKQSCQKKKRTNKQKKNKKNKVLLSNNACHAFFFQIVLTWFCFGFFWSSYLFGLIVLFWIIRFTIYYSRVRKWNFLIGEKIIIFQFFFKIHV